MLHCGADQEVVDSFTARMKDFCELSSQHERSISYLGLNIEYDPDRKVLRVDQREYAQALLDRSGIDDTPLKNVPTAPSSAEHMKEEDDAELLTENEQKDYRSLVMGIMFLARLTRPDLLFTTTVLATHCSHPTLKNMREVYRVLRYIKGTVNYGLTMRGKMEIQPVIFADASHALHPSGHGHGGILITLGTAPILTRSFKISMATRSSAESELVCLDEAAAYAVWLRLLLYELQAFKKDVPTVTVYQDNKSTIEMAKQPYYNFKRSKHLLVRENYVKERETPYRRYPNHIHAD